MRKTLLPALLMTCLAGCEGDPAPGPGTPAAGASAPSQHTAAANTAAGRELADAKEPDPEAAERGFIASDPSLILSLHGDKNQPVWDMTVYDFIEGRAPASVHPGLWRQARRNNRHGLFRVTDRVYQVRGYDLSNMTLIEGDSGWIVVDPLTARETARAAFALAQRELGRRPIRAIVFTHSHIDHFGGVLGLFPDGVPGDIRVIAPRGFSAAATSENILAGPTMGRRAMHMYGGPLPRGERGHVDSGLGKSPAAGHAGFLEPTETVDTTGQRMTVDGVEFVFQYTPEAEAPAGLTFYLPRFHAFCAADLLVQSLHNLYTPRGAKVRDALKWTGYIDEILQRLGGDIEVLFASHNWPVWGNAAVRDYLRIQRDTYKYIHDQTLRLANNGYTPTEIAERLRLPEDLREPLHNRGYYGTVRHNSRAVYDWYFGWYDGNPAHLNPLPPAQTAPRYIALMGGADKVLEKATDAYREGQYRWTAELLDRLVFAQPDNDEARELLAKTYDQLGYQAQSAAWRDLYLTAAYELRHGNQGSALDMGRTLELLRAAPIEKLLDAMATRLNGPEAGGVALTVNFDFTDRGQNHVLTVDNAVLHHRRGPVALEADATVHLTHDMFLRLSTRQAGLKELIFSDELDIDGSRLKLLKFFSLLEAPNLDFNLVTP